jgi:hypothetical protein
MQVLRGKTAAIDQMEESISIDEIKESMSPTYLRASPTA